MFRYFYLIILFNSFIFGEEILLKYRHLPSFPIINYKNKNFCFDSFNDSQYINYKDFLYQAAKINLIQGDDCKLKFIVHSHKKPLYTLSIKDGDKKIFIHKKVIKNYTKESIRKALSDLFVPYVIELKQELSLLDPIQKQALNLLKDGQLKRGLNLLLNLKKSLEQKRFSKVFSSFDLKIYQSVIFQIASFYEKAFHLKKSLVYYQLFHRHTKSKDAEIAINRVLKRQKNQGKLEKLLRKYL